MKFYVKDEDGKNFAIEEIEEIPVTEDEDEIFDEDNVLTADEISALKRLAAVSDRLVSLLDEDEIEDEDEDEDEDEIEDEDEDEEVLDTDEEERKSKTTDSRKSFGKITRQKKTNDSSDTLTDDVANAWAKRYGGK